MKKNYLFGLLSLFTLLFAASCQEEELAGGQMGDTATVTFSVNTPTIATRAVGAVGDGTTATKLYVAVYENQNGTAGNLNLVGPLPVSLIDEGETVTFTDRVATVELALAKNKEYSVIFWADTENNDDAIFDIDWNTRELKLKSTLKANQEKYDAFWAQKTVKLTGALTETVELKRPFAQLNIGTSDKEAAANAGIVVEKTAVTVKQIPTVLNLQDSKVDVNSYADVTYALDSIADIADEVFPADKDNQEYLSLNYLLVDEKITVDVDFSYMDAEEGENALYNLSFTSVPVQRNYRTNIYGTLLTNSANYTVEIKPGFGNDGEEDAANIVYVTTAEEMIAALAADKESIEVRLLNDIELPISKLGQQTPGSGEYKLGNENTDSITFDLNGKKLNITTSYMSAIGAKNADALIIIKNGTMTSTGNSANTWNIYDLIFANCNYAIEDVTFEKSIAFDNVGKKVSVKNVTINETKDLYAMWVCAVGQTLDIEGLTINAPAGRGIKIDEQYVGEEVAKVTINVKNAKFNTEKKAAIMVKSAAGADITLEDIDLTGVKADGFNAVWVDADSKDHADKVTVTGGFAIVESDIVSEGVSLVKENVYNVWSAKGLSYFSEKNLSGVTLNIINDLDFAGAEFKAIIAARSGELNINGNGNTIKNAKVVSGNGDNTTGQASFFYAFPGSTLKVDNLKFDNIEVDAEINGSGYAGVVVGYAEGNVVLNDVDVNKADVYGEKSCGALVGFAPAGSTLSMTDCDVTNSRVEAKEDRTGAYLGRAIGNTAIVTCSVDDNFISVAPDGYANKYIGQRYTSCASLTIDGIEYVDTYYGLDNAVKKMTTPEATFLLAKGTFALPTSFGGKTLNLEGVDKEATILDMTKTGSSLPQYGGTGLSCKNMTVQRALYDYQGFQGQEEHYDNCIISGRLMTYSPLVTANECTFLPGASDDYNVQIYEAGTATFTNCKFNAYKGRSVYAYAESAKEMNLTFTGCEFTSVNGKNENNFAPAIRLHTELGIHGTLTINDCKNDDNFNTTINGGLWVEWNNQTKKFTNNFVKTINGASFVNADVYTVAQLQEAIANAEAGTVITLADGTYEGLFWPKRSITLKAINEYGATINGKIAAQDATVVTLNGLKLTNENSKSITTSAHQYLAKTGTSILGAYNASFVVDNCIFDIKEHYGIYMQEGEAGYARVTNSTFNCNGFRPIIYKADVVVDNCTFNDQYKYSLQLYGYGTSSNKVANVSFTNNTVVDAGKTSGKEAQGVSISGSYEFVEGNIHIQGNTAGLVYAYDNKANVTNYLDSWTVTGDVDKSNFVARD